MLYGDIKINDLKNNSRKCSSCILNTGYRNLQHTFFFSSCFLSLLVACSIISFFLVTGRQTAILIWGIAKGLQQNKYYTARKNCAAIVLREIPVSPRLVGNLLEGSMNAFIRSLAAFYTFSLFAVDVFCFSLHLFVRNFISRGFVAHI